MIGYINNIIVHWLVQCLTSPTHNTSAADDVWTGIEAKGEALELLNWSMYVFG